MQIYNTNACEMKQKAAPNRSGLSNIAVGLGKLVRNFRCSQPPMT